MTLFGDVEVGRSVYGCLVKCLEFVELSVGGEGCADSDVGVVYGFIRRWRAVQFLACDFSDCVVGTTRWWVYARVGEASVAEEVVGETWLGGSRLRLIGSVFCKNSADERSGSGRMSVGWTEKCWRGDHDGSSEVGEMVDTIRSRGRSSARNSDVARRSGAICATVCDRCGVDDWEA